MSKYIIGIDGGGTKTLGVLFTLDGKEIKRIRKGFCNFSVNEVKSLKNLYDSIDSLFEEINKQDVKFIQIGISGYSNYSKKQELISDLQRKYKVDADIVTDAEIALYSVKKNTDKQVIMILGGTGSVIMYEKDGLIRFIGGFGHLMGDDGSGYHLAISALKNIITQHENNEKPSALSIAILKEIGAKDYLEIKNFIYNNQKNDIAKLSLFIANYAKNGNDEAIELFKNEGKLLVNQAKKAIKSLDILNDIVIGIKGGFLLYAPKVKETLIEELNKLEINYELDNHPLEPIYGAYYLAIKKMNKRWHDD